VQVYEEALQFVPSPMMFNFYTLFFMDVAVLYFLSNKNLEKKIEKKF
jgi:hypothetical protein